MALYTLFDDVQMFLGDPNKRTRIPKVRIVITKKDKSNLYLSSGFILGLPDNGFRSHMLFSYSQKAKAIIFEFTDDYDFPGLIKVSRPKNTNTATVAMHSFSERFGLDIMKIKGDYIPEYKEISERKSAWVVFLDKKLGEE